MPAALLSLGLRQANPLLLMHLLAALAAGLGAALHLACPPRHAEEQAAMLALPLM